MLVLLPPSEGKTVPARGRRLDLSTLSLPALTPTRERILDALTSLAAGNSTEATRVLGLGPTQADEVARDARLRSAPTAPRTPAGLVEVLRDLGWRVEASGTRLDVIIDAG